MFELPVILAKFVSTIAIVKQLFLKKSFGNPTLYLKLLQALHRINAEFLKKYFSKLLSSSSS